MLQVTIEGKSTNCSQSIHLGVTAVRRKQIGSRQYAAWRRGDLSQQTYVSFGTDGIRAKVRLEVPENDKQCMLDLMGAAADGQKELLDVVEGYREGEQSWHELLVDFNQRGLVTGRKLATADAVWGFWAALRKVVRRLASNGAGCTRR